ncbi:hypothetical protein [Yersinia enterocolitica]|uniref:hypothetical protein n=1 Tax=Yersinia enterocolitica TaxID=630 RepID=UPI0032F333B1|nr:hypothetical protein [Yersinia enterocolitica]
MELVFTVLAGKVETNNGEEIENIKFCDDSDTLGGAMKIIQINQLYTYPICKIEVTGFKAA